MAWLKKWRKAFDMIKGGISITGSWYGDPSLYNLFLYQKKHETILHPLKQKLLQACIVKGKY